MKNRAEERLVSRRSDGRERRKHRSADMGQALQLQLDACRREGGVDAILVSDDLGLCVASSGVGHKRDELAARIPPAAVAGLNTLPAGEPSLGDSTAFKSFVIDRSELFVCVVGGHPENQAASLDRAENGFRRILAA